MHLNMFNVHLLHYAVHLDEIGCGNVAGEGSGELCGEVSNVVRSGQGDSNSLKVKVGVNHGSELHGGERGERVTIMIVAIYRRSCATDGTDQEWTENEAHLLSTNGTFVKYQQTYSYWSKERRQP